MTIPHSASLALTTRMTLEAWVYPTNVSAVWRDVIMKGSDEYYLEATLEDGQEVLWPAGAPASNQSVVVW